MQLVAYEPDIPQNLGSLIRLCACMGVGLSVIEPCGFVLDDKRLKRVAMDYKSHTTRYPSWEQFVAQKPAGKTFPAVERRGPDRSKKVTRIASTKPAAAPRAEPPELTAQAATRKPAAAAEGGDDDWTTF
jgi:tRNA(Leu) C34 or U34 (ribose-2'-O)-methylase TrmL